MWTLAPRLARWNLTYQMSFLEIWNDHSYLVTGLPQELPMIAAVCPSDPNVIYFALEKSMFAVNIPAHQVVDCSEDGLVSVLPPSGVSSRYVLPWTLPPSITGPLFKDKEEEADDLMLAYAKYCYKRDAIFLEKKGFDLCHICFFKLGNATPVRKTGIRDHCVKVHNATGYPCNKKGCPILMGTQGEAGQHEHYCHGQKRNDWWRQFFE